MPDRARRMRSRPAFWFALAESIAVMPWVVLSLRTRGFAGTMRSAAGSSTGAQAAPRLGAPVPVPVLVVTAAVTAVAGRRRTGWTCLPRAVTIVRLARRRGHEVELCLGVASPAAGVLPAHAWVEYGGRPLNDTADVRDRYHVIPVPVPTERNLSAR
ncbi:lasso peptide biosynthesis B2 protein [Aeromicrobium ginsengisoli]|uniref:Lasso peptide biosynthesis B2 protein n=2 Tax=Aeromicrobium ginsengisoli TaxID=363867 RepID=A0A5M4FA15_9ACTN|nr:lasso peptide biosynthesis B2 protein [Aeromicrobium ginsengisoli]